MFFCCNPHRDYQLINKGHAFIKQQIKWFSQFIVAYCYLTRLDNTSHLKAVSNKHLVELNNNALWTLFITLKRIKETRSFFFINEAKLTELLKLYVNIVNSIDYAGTHAIAFNHDLMVPTLLYFVNEINQPNILDLILFYISQCIKRDFQTPNHHINSI